MSTGNNSGALAGARKAAFGSRALGSYIPDLTRKAYERFGFATAEILNDWPRIAGADLSRFTRPERLKWPRETAAAEEGPRTAAVLILAVEPSHALDVEYRSGEIAQRVNAYFGFHAVEKIKVIQTPGVVTAPAAQARETAILAAPPADLAFVSDEALRSSLSGLLANIRREHAAINN